MKQAMKLLRALRWELALMALTLIWPLLVFGGANLLTEVVNRAAADSAAQLERQQPMTTMRAKLQVGTVERGNGFEKLNFHAVAAKGYPADGSDEDNTYAKFSPSASLTIHVNNPALHGKFNPGDKFYVDFTPAEA